jgi:hypothetical protein
MNQQDTLIVSTIGSTGLAIVISKSLKTSDIAGKTFRNG